MKGSLFNREEWISNKRRFSSFPDILHLFVDKKPQKNCEELSQVRFFLIFMIKYIIRAECGHCCETDFEEDIDRCLQGILELTLVQRTC